MEPVDPQHSTFDVGVCTDPAQAISPVHSLDSRPLGGLRLPIGLGRASGPDAQAPDRLPTESQLAQLSQSTLSPPPNPIQELLCRLTSPISAPLLAGPRSTPKPHKQKRQRRPPATATRRSLRVQGRKDAVTGGGNTSLRLARRLLVGKRGLAIAEPGEEEEEETLERYKLTFKKPLSDS